MVENVEVPILTCWSLLVRKSLIHRQREVQINKRHPYVCFGAFNVAESGVEGDGDCVVCGSLGPVGKLVLVKAGWDMGLDIL